MRATQNHTLEILAIATITAALCSCGADRASPPPVSASPAPANTLFADVTEEAGIKFVHHNGRDGTHRYPEIMGGGVALFDFDNDGWLDIFFVNGNHLATDASRELGNVLYRNQGDGTFEDVTEHAGLADSGYGQGCCVADYDSDGDQDLYVTNFGPDRFYSNNANGTFSEVADTAGLQAPVRELLGENAWGQACAFLDIDGDNDLDLYLQHYLKYDLDDQQEVSTIVRGKKMRDYLAPQLFPGAPDFLFRNDGDGRFTDVTVDSGILRPGGRGMGAACVDFDDDGDVDIMVANDGMDNYFFKNNGVGIFTEVGHLMGVAFNGTGAVESSMGVDVGDVDGDGLQDMVIPVIRREVFTLYTNQGSFFRDISVQAGLAKATRWSTGFSPNLADFDNDGDLDLYVTCGGVVSNEEPASDRYEDRYGMPDQLMLNDGTGRFSDHRDNAGPYFQRTLIGRGSAAGDIDNDGDMDLVVNNLDGPAVLLRNLHRENNRSSAGSWLSIRLVGRAPNRDAIGSRIEVEAGGHKQVSVSRGGGSYLSANDRRLHFGLGGATTVDRITIRWPTGAVQELTSIDVNQILRVEEP